MASKLKDEVSATRKPVGQNASEARRVSRLRRHARLRKKVAGTAERPRLVVNPSNSSTFPPLPRTINLKASSGESSGTTTSTEMSLPVGPLASAVTR